MRPTRGPDPDGMPAEYGMYGDYEEYDEDDFFYHMYFDEVSTTPLPDEFYEILESVSASGNNNQNEAGGADYFSDYPSYFDYLLNSRVKTPSDSDNDTKSDDKSESSERQSKNNRYLKLERSASSNRRNSKFLKFKNKKRSNKVSTQRQSKVMRHSEHLTSDTVTQRQNTRVSRSKRSAVKSNRTQKTKKWNRNKWIRIRDRKRKKLERRKNPNSRIVGILDRRIPVLFRQNPFVTISLAKFVVLSTGVTTAAVATTAADIGPIIPPVVVVKPSVVVPTVSIPTSSWTPDKWGTWPFITISGVSASNITYLLVSLFILYVGIILYVDGDYLYNKVKEFAIKRLSNVRRNVIKRVHTESGLNYLTDTLTSAWDAMKANFGVSPSATAPHGWLAPHRGAHRKDRPGAGGYYKRQYQQQRPYRRRRRKFYKKPQSSESDIYSSSNYRRTVSKQDAYSWGAQQPKAKNSGRKNWYRGDYQDDFEESHDYFQPSLEKIYRENYSYSDYESDDYSYEYTR